MILDAVESQGQVGFLGLLGYNFPPKKIRGFIVTVLLFLVLLLAVVAFGTLTLPGRSELEEEEYDNDDEDLVSSSSLPISGTPLHLKPKRNPALVAAPDGTIYFVEIDSGKVLWSFASGSSIYSSYQALPDHDAKTESNSVEGDDFYIDVGEDWELYVHGNNGFNKMKLPLTAEELLRRTPLTTSGGGVLLGSKKSTVFILDAKTGKVIHTFKSDNFSSVDSQDDDENSIVPWVDVEDWAPTPVDLDGFDEILYVTRKDYALRYTSMKTGKILWYLNFADIETSLKCDGVRNLLETIISKGGESDHGPRLEMNLPYHCPLRPVVYRIRDRSSLESLFMTSSSPSALPVEELFFLPSADFRPMLKPVDKMLGFDRINEGDPLLALPIPEVKDFEVMALPGEVTGGSYAYEGSGFVAMCNFWPFVLSGVVMLFIAVLHSCSRHLLFRKSVKNEELAEKIKTPAVALKKKKTRRSGISKKSSIVVEKQKEVSNDQMVSVVNNLPDIRGNERKFLVDLSKCSDDLAGGRKIGRLFVSTKEIGRGSNGTVVLEGIHDGRDVAVKRLVQTHHDVALKEIQNLIASDQHPNIVRWYGVEYDKDFVYLALERCNCSLHDLIVHHSTSSRSQATSHGEGANSCTDQSVRLGLKVDCCSEFELWKPNGYPTSHLLKLMRDVVHGIAHLHELGIVHRDLKPQNVLVVKERTLYAKLSDMGISKRLAGDMTSLTQHATGYGSSGWQAPEQLRHERQTRAVDLFSLGCLLFFCISGGQHPFGESLERDMNIVNNRKDLFLIDNLPEATDLIDGLLNPSPELRPRATQVLCHPFFWTSEMRLSFLRDASDRVELEDRENGSQLLRALESTGDVAFAGKWDDKLDAAFINDIGHYRRYKFDSVRDLLRVIRNKLNHYRELSKEIQGIVGQIPEGFDSYFSTRFPKLLIEVYRVTQIYCAEEESFQKYFRSNQH